MPLWVLLAGGGAILWWLASRASGPVAGAQRYTVNGSTPFYTLDPTTSQGATGAGTLAQGTTVYATATTPVLSADYSYELVLTPSNGTVWVSVAFLSSS